MKTISIRLVFLSALICAPVAIKSMELEQIKNDLKLLTERVEYIDTEVGNLKNKLETQRVIKGEEEIHETEATAQEKPTYKVCMKDRCKKISDTQAQELANKQPNAKVYRCHRGKCQLLRTRPRRDFRGHGFIGRGVIGRKP